MRYLESLNNALFHLMENDDRIILLGEDIIDPYGGAFKVTKGLSTKFPSRVITTPISEAAITGFSTGLALRGFKPILEIMFGDFITLCTDQIINGATKFSWMYGDHFSTPLFIRTPMGGGRGYGPTHSQTLESLYFGVSGLTIIAPSNYHDPGHLLIETINNISNPTLFIENKILYPTKIMRPDNKSMIDDFHFFTINKSNKDYPTISIVIEKDIQPDITLITYGRMVDNAINAAKNLFFEEEILVNILIPSLLKPLPIDDFIDSVNTSGKVIILEEGGKIAGWGAEASSQIYEKCFKSISRPIERIGSGQTPIPSSKVLEDDYFPNQFIIEQKIKTLYDK